MECAAPAAGEKTGACSRGVYVGTGGTERSGRNPDGVGTIALALISGCSFSCCFLLPLLLASAKLVTFWYHLSAHLTSLWFCTGCVSLDTALPGDALPGATQGLAPHKGSG